MKKIKIFLPMMLGVLLTLSSCFSEGVEEATLTLSEDESIEVSKQASEMTIDVKTNQKDWSAYVNVDWIETIKGEASVDLIFSENSTTLERKANLLVIAGSKSKVISIVQTASKVEFSMSKDTLYVDQWSGNFSIDIETNSKTWSVEVPDDAESWIKAIAKPTKGEISIEIGENKDLKARESVINVVDKSTKEVRELVICQSGIMYYTFPLITPESQYSDIMDFENSNRSSRKLDKDFIMKDIIAFETRNPAFPHIEYCLGNKYVESVWLVAENQDILLDKRFSDMLKKDGFERMNYPGTRTGAEIVWAKEVTGKSGRKFRISAEVNVGTVGTQSVLVYEIFPLEEKPYMSSYDKLPLGYTDFKDKKVNMDTVRVWEEKNKGKYNKDWSHLDTTGKSPIYHVFNAEGPYFLRSYVLDKDSNVKRTWLFLRDVTMCFYEFDDIYYPSARFEELCEKSGYESLGLDDAGYYCYSNADENLEISLKATNLENITTTKLVELYVDVLDSSDITSSAKKRLTELDEFLNRVKKYKK